MPYQGPPTLAPGTVPQFNEWNTFVRGNVEFLAAPPAARVHRSTLQTVTTGGSGAVVTFDVEDHDSDTMWTGGTQVLVNTPGLYVVTAGAVFATNATGARQVGLRLNGTTVIGGASVPGMAGSPIVLSGTAVYPLNIGDYLELLVFQSSGGDLDVTVTAMPPFLALVWQSL